VSGKNLNAKHAYSLRIIQKFLVRLNQTIAGKKEQPIK
jgi:hypothetical protein